MRRILSVCFALVMILACYVPTYAVEVRTLSDELADMSFDGVPFDPEDYPEDPLGELQVLTVSEWGAYEDIDDRFAHADEYHVYVWIYNPSLARFDCSHFLSRISLQVGSTNFIKYRLRYCGSAYNDRFMKFEVSQINSDASLIYVFSNPVRTYQVSGIELVLAGSTSAYEYTVGGAWAYSGWRAGHDEDHSSTDSLECTYHHIDVIELDVHGTTYIGQTVSASGEGYRNQLNSVWFEMPKAYTDYDLTEISCTYTKLRTQPIFVTSNRDVYEDFARNALYGTGTSSYYWRHKGGSDAYWSGEHQYSFDYYDIGYNHDYTTYNRGNPYRQMLFLPYVFYQKPGTGNSLLESVMHPFRSYAASRWFSSTEVCVTGEELLSYMHRYSMSLNLDPSFTYYPTLHDYLFCEPGDGYGEQVLTVPADRSYSLLSYSSAVDNARLIQIFTPSLWFTDISTDEEVDAAIVRVSDLSGMDKEDVAETYKIDINDAAAFTSDVYWAKTRGTDVVLFRFDQGEYYADEVDVFKTSGGSADGDSFIAQTDVYLDFDIISLTFEDADIGYSFVVPVSSDPINIVPDIVGPLNHDNPFVNLAEKDDGTFMRIVGLVLLLVLILVLWKPISALLKLIFRPLTAWIKRRREKRKAK